MADIYDVRTERGRGAGQKVDVVREVEWIMYSRSDPNVDRGRGYQNSKNFGDVINGSPLRTNT